MPPTKTTDDDIESGQSEATTINEETPLLISQDDPRAGPDNDAVEESEQDEGSRYTRSYFAWRIFWTVAAITVTGVFVKAWIDAGADVNLDFKGALKRALGGGISGAAAMVLQVLLLMPLRTIMNYQYRFGTSFTTATKTLYRQGGLRRYYDGMGAALFQGPAARFGDTAANAGIHALLQSNSFLKRLPITIQDIFASFCAAAFRMILTPIDTLKTTLQAQGSRGTAILRQRIKTDGVGSLWWGAFATAAATFVGNYPWYATHDYLLEIIPEPAKDRELAIWLLRLAFAGFVASVVSDSVSNSLRVVKTYRQVNDKKVSYSEAARLVIVNDGIKGLLGRGLKTRILCNGLQGLMFSVLWKLFLDLWNKKTAHL
ncbi:mitochondrial carrier domain-protein [Copromyces sp. CBS 386.78]|nr:mitochondrial carrier domain-protein [Copromyces sp. CBS 386.78]